MKQSYNADQHTKAKKDSLPLVTIGFNGKYLPPGNERGAAYFYGPVSKKMMDKVRKLFIEICSDR